MHVTDSLDKIQPKLLVEQAGKALEFTASVVNTLPLPASGFLGSTLLFGAFMLRTVENEGQLKIQVSPEGIEVNSEYLCSHIYSRVSLGQQPNPCRQWTPVWSPHCDQEAGQGCQV